MRFALVNIACHFYPAFVRARQRFNELLPPSWRTILPVHTPANAPEPAAPVPVYRSPSRSRRPRRTARRPARRTGKVKIKFASKNRLLFTDTGHDLNGIVDALTGASLQGMSGLRQCARCKVFYQEQSFQFIRKENRGRCVACLSTVIKKTGLNFSPRNEPASPAPPLTPPPHIVMPASYHGHDGRVVTIEGIVVDVLTSRGGLQHALMFERTTWAKGLKLVLSSRVLHRIGGPNILRGLREKTVCVRGLLKNHPLLGPQIIASGPEAIVWVR
jgi:hypothetical protein